MNSKNKTTTGAMYSMLCMVLILLFSSCEKEVHINLQSSAPRVVVQGAIETGEPPYVILTSSVSFFSKVDLETLQNSFIHDAIVQVSDGTNTITLKEYALDTGSGFKFYAYSINPLEYMEGEVGKSYKLTITHKGNVYSAVTKIPTPQGVDSMWFDVPDFAGNKTPDSARQLFVNYTDPDTPGDYVRCFTAKNSNPFYPSTNFSDEIVNGKTINNIGLFAGYSDNSEITLRDSLIYFFPGDTVTLKWCAIDKAVYDFWNTLDFAKSAVGNPFSSPINPMTNLTNGAVGIWAGYGAYYKTKVVPR